MAPKAHFKIGDVLMALDGTKIYTCKVSGCTEVASSIDGKAGRCDAA
jgi:hypothetical protein